MPDLNEIEGMLQQVFEQPNTGASGQRVLAALSTWLVQDARKKELPDLQARMESFRKRIEVLAATVRLAYDTDRSQVVIKTSGDSDATLRLLERGSDWFDPLPGVRDVIAAAILAAP
jgi:hypothetical protein